MKCKNDISYYCPRQLDKFPTEPCPVAIRTLEALSNGASEEDEGLCPWYVPDIDSNHCFWLLLDREAPIDNPKEIARLLGMTKNEVESYLDSAIAKLNAIGLKAKVIVDWIDAMDACAKPVDDSIYLKLFDLDAYYDPLVDADDSDKAVWDPENINEDYRSPDLADFQLANKVVPNKRREALKHMTRGNSGAGAIHKSGKRIQLYGLSAKWGKDLKKWADEGTPILMAKYTLEHVKKAANEEKPETESTEKDT